MSEGRLARWSPAFGLVFVVLFAVGIALSGDIPGADSSDAKILAYYRDHGNQMKLEIAYYLATLAVVAFLWFAGTVASRIAGLGAPSPWLSRIAIGSGTAAGIVMLAGFAADSMVASTADHTSKFHIDPNTARVIADFAYPLTFETGLPLVAPFVIAITLALRRARVAPRWFGPAGIAVGLLCLVGFLGVPMGLFLVWVATAAVVLLRARTETEVVQAAAAEPVT
jgi:hypothetical protein